MKVGDKIRILYTVTHIDDAGQIHGTWGGCALIPGVDEYKVIKNDDMKAFGVVLGIYVMVYLIISMVEQITGVVI